MPRRYKQGADGQPHPAFYGKLPEEFSKTDTMRFMVETDLKLSGRVSADTLAALRAEGYDYKDGNLVPAGKEETMQEKVADATPAAPLKLDVSVRVIEPVKNLMGFASVKFNDCFVVEDFKILQSDKGLYVGMPSKPDKSSRTGYRDTVKPITKEFREELHGAILEAYQQETDDVQQWMKLIREYAKLEELDRPTLLRLIKRIEVGEKKVEDGCTVRDIKIHYNFVGYIEA